MAEIERRRVVAAAAGSLALGAMGGLQPARAADFPARPVRLVVTFPAGSGPDTIARSIAPRMGEVLGQQVVVDNRPGAGGNVAALAVLGERHDGHTLLMGTDSIYSLNPFLFPRAGYDATTDFTVLAPLAEAGVLLVVNSELGIDSVEALVARVKAQPGRFNVSAPTGTPHHMAAERFAMLNALQWTRVSYRDPQQAVTELVAGLVPIAFSTWPSIAPHVQSGKLRALAVSTPDRFAAWPQVPSLSERHPGFEETAWFALLAPQGVPEAARRLLADAARQAREGPDLAPRLAMQGMRPLAADPQAFEARIRRERQAREALIRSRGIRAD